ncbi:MAG TPA: CheY-P-specific phosphatase CheC [Chloroflexi bacterium]|jgi:chemotaxis protein CheC|nr:CheY-P-specific phosphatase CheC [Chloroflexota bacterium]
MRISDIPLQNNALKTTLHSMACEGVELAAEGLSTFVGEQISISSPQVAVIPLAALPKVMGGPESIGVGVYLAVEGDIQGHVMLLLSRESALELVGLLLDTDEENITTLGPLERSALGEIGNLTASRFLNCMARYARADLRPSPPAVIEDMIGAILDVLAVAVGQHSEYALIMETVFRRTDRSVEALFWVVPDVDSLEQLTQIAETISDE